MLFTAFQAGHRRQRKARAVLVWLLLVFAGCQVGLIVTEEWYCPFLRDPDYGYKALRLQRRLASARAKLTTIVMLGSSRTLSGLCAAPLESELRKQTGRPVVLFNFGIPAAGPVIHLLVLKRLLHSGIRPDGVLVELLPGYLAGPASRGAADLPVQRLWHGELSEIQALDPRHRDRTSLWLKRAWLWPGYTYRRTLINHFTAMLLPPQARCDFFPPIDDHGWHEVPPMPYSAELRQYLSAIAYQHFAPYWDDYQPGGPNCDALRRLLQLCREEEIAVKLVVLPEGPIFRSWYPAPAWRAFEAFLERIRRECAVEVVNAREWVAEEGFYDSHHMVPLGAQCFSERLGREVLAPWLREGLR